MKYVLASLLFLALMVVAAFLNNIILTVLCMVASFISLVVWFLSQSKIKSTMLFLSPWICIAGGICFLVIFRFGSLLLLSAVAYPGLFFKLLSQSLSDGVHGIMFFLVFYSPPILGIVLIITGIWQLYHRYFKKNVEQKNNA